MHSAARGRKKSGAECTVQVRNAGWSTRLVSLWPSFESASTSTSVSRCFIPRAKRLSTCTVRVVRRDCGRCSCYAARHRLCCAGDVLLDSGTSTSPARSGRAAVIAPQGDSVMKKGNSRPQFSFSPALAPTQQTEEREDEATHEARPRSDLSVRVRVGRLPLGLRRGRGAGRKRREGDRRMALRAVRAGQAERVGESGRRVPDHSDRALPRWSQGS